MFAAGHDTGVLVFKLERERIANAGDYSIAMKFSLIDQMLAHYLVLLDNALAEPNRGLTRLDMLDNGERKTVLEQSHGELVAKPATTMVAMLEAAAAANPDKVALVSDEAELTYAWPLGLSTTLALHYRGQSFDDVADRNPLKGAALLDLRAAYPLTRAIEVYGEQVLPALAKSPAR